MDGGYVGSAPSKRLRPMTDTPGKRQLAKCWYRLMAGRYGNDPAQREPVSRHAAGSRRYVCIIGFPPGYVNKGVYIFSAKCLIVPYITLANIPWLPRGGDIGRRLSGFGRIPPHPSPPTQGGMSLYPRLREHTSFSFCRIRPKSLPHAVLFPQPAVNPHSAEAPTAGLSPPNAPSDTGYQ